MTKGKFLAGGLVVVALLGGALMYWLQVYAYYDRVDFGAEDIQLTPMVTEVPEPIPADDVSGIDASSSPLRFRACFTTPLSLPMLTETYVIYDEAAPLNAPNWFDCFDAQAIGAALQSGSAVAFLGEKNVAYGVDRVVAVFEDGRAYAWHQLNNCGETAYDGSPVGEACPPREGE
jgi:hypothetical protein